jgi:hypothetical protein
MLYEPQNRARFLSGNDGTSPSRPSSPFTSLRSLAPEGSAVARKTPVQFYESVGMPRVSNYGSRPTSRKHHTRSNNVDLTCTLPEDETPSYRPRSSRVWEMVSEKAHSAAQPAAGHKVRQSAAACGEGRQCQKPPARKSVRKLILRGCLVVTGRANGA